MANAEEDEEVSIFELILANDLEKLKSLPISWLESKLRMRQSGKTALMVACEENATDIAMHLLSCGKISARMNDVSDAEATSSGWTPLHYACYNQNVVLVTELLRRGAKVFPTHKGTWATEETPLRVAAQRGHNDVINALLEGQPPGGDYVNHRLNSTDAMTPIFDAVIHKNLDTVVLLLDRGADVNLCDEELRTPLHHALEVGSKRNRNIVDLLLEKTVDINRQDSDGNTALHVAVECRDVYAIDQLASRGATLLENSDDLCPVAIAIIQKSKRILDKLLGIFNTVINHTKLEEWLYEACESGSVSCVERILNHQHEFLSKVLRSYQISHRALKLAAECGSASVVRMLIQYGCHVGRGLWRESGRRIVRLFVEGGDIFEARERRLNLSASNRIERMDDLDLIKFFYQHGFKPSWHECKKVNPPAFCPFARHAPEVLSLQRLAANVIRATIVHTQNAHRQKRRPFQSLYSSVKTLQLPEVIRHFLVDLRLVTGDGDDDDMTEFDLFPVSESDRSEASTSSESESESESGSESDGDSDKSRN